jgi:glutamate synthase (NADPH/NADH) small chain
VEWKKDESGRMNMVEVPGSEFSIQADLIFLAMGFIHVEHSEFNKELGIEYDPRGNISVKNYQTSVPKIFAAGDSATGASLVVRAIYHGRQAAANIHKFLMG